MPATTEADNTAAADNSDTATVAAGEAPPSSNPAKSIGIITTSGDAIVRNRDRTEARRARRTQGISDSKTEAPLATRY